MITWQMVFVGIIIALPITWAIYIRIELATAHYMIEKLISRNTELSNRLYKIEQLVIPKPPAPPERPAVLRLPDDDYPKFLKRKREKLVGADGELL